MIKKTRLFFLSWMAFATMSAQLSEDCKIEAFRMVPDMNCDFEYDIIIVGNGTAGAVLARKLTDVCNAAVLVLEIGINRTDDPIVLSSDIEETQETLTFDPKYATSYALPQDNDQIAYYAEGRMWGGSSANNYLVATRGTPSVYNQWANISGNLRWSYSNLLPFMLGIETYTPTLTLQANYSQRGYNGPLFITQSNPITQDPFSIAITTATNTPFVVDYNDPLEGDLAVSPTQYFITPGQDSHRSFSANAFLKVGTVVDEDGNGLNGRHLKIISNTMVSKVIFEHDKAIGVEYILGVDTKNTFNAFAAKKVILCAGGVNTPAILQRSGIGDPALLNSLGIEVVVNNPNVGANLINQYGPFGIIVGTTSATPFSTAFINASPFMPNDSIRRLQLVGSIFSPTEIKMAGILVNPHSRGSVRIVDTNPLVKPVIDLNLYSDGSASTPGTDAYLGVAFLKIIKDIAADFGTAVVTPPPAFYPPPYGPAPDDSLLVAYLRDIVFDNVITDQIVGTTRMGTSISNGVVDGNLNVFGVCNLMVADVGVEPVSIDGNIAFSAYVIGVIASQLLLH